MKKLMVVIVPIALLALIAGIIIFGISQINKTFNDNLDKAQLESLDFACKNASANKDSSPVSVEGYVRLPVTELKCANNLCGLIFYTRANATDNTLTAQVNFSKNTAKNSVSDLPIGFYTNYAEFKLNGNDGKSYGINEKVRLTGPVYQSDSKCMIDVQRIIPAPEPDAKSVTVGQLCNLENDNKILKVSGYVRALYNNPITWGGYVTELDEQKEPNDKSIAKSANNLIAFSTQDNKPNTLAEYTRDKLSKFRDINNNLVDVSNTKFSLIGQKYTILENGKNSCRFDVEYIKVD